jgi:predicted nucleic acid-binding protein
LKILVDINVILDAILERKEWLEEAGLLLSAIENGQVEGYVAAHTITTTHYLVAKQKGRTVAASVVTDLLRIVRVVQIGGADFLQALLLGMNDYEDAVQVVAALQIGADYLVTRNARDFKSAPVQAHTPGEVLALL